jgi:flagellar protein FliS
MTYAAGPNALRNYQKMHVEQEVADASPYQLIQLMLDRLLAKIAVARGHVERGDAGAKGPEISRAIALVDGLRVSLDADRGGEIAANLAGLYDYISRRLLHAQLHDDPSALNEVASLVREIKSAWEAIADQVDAGSASPAAGAGAAV